MDRDQLIHELSKALIERDHYRRTQDEMRIKADEAQSKAYELELMLFEPGAEPVYQAAQDTSDGDRLTVVQRVENAARTLLQKGRRTTTYDELSVLTGVRPHLLYTYQYKRYFNHILKKKPGGKPAIFNIIITEAN